MNMRLISLAFLAFLAALGSSGYGGSKEVFGLLSAK